MNKKIKFKLKYKNALPDLTYLAITEKCDWNVSKRIKMCFNTIFRLSLKKGIFWKLKPLSAGGYMAHLSTWK